MFYIRDMEDRELKRAFEKSWSSETCYPKQKLEWSKNNPALGQCAVTALIINDLLGGEILFNQELNHFWNLLPDGSEIDLTREQFGAVEISESERVTRQEILDSDTAFDAKTLSRYNRLKEKVLPLLLVKAKV